MSQNSQKLTWKIFIEEFVFYGTYELTDTLEFEYEISHMPSWMEPMKQWWSLSIKYFSPWILVQLLMSAIALEFFKIDQDEDVPSHVGWDLVKIAYIVPFLFLCVLFNFIEYELPR